MDESLTLGGRNWCRTVSLDLKRPLPERSWKHNPEEKISEDILRDCHRTLTVLTASLWALCHCSPLTHPRFDRLFARIFIDFSWFSHLFWRFLRFFMFFSWFFHVLPCFPRFLILKVSNAARCAASYRIPVWPNPHKRGCVRIRSTLWQVAHQTIINRYQHISNYIKLKHLRKPFDYCFTIFTSTFIEFGVKVCESVGVAKVSGSRWPCCWAKSFPNFEVPNFIWFLISA